MIYGFDAAEAAFRALDAGVELERLAPEARVAWARPGAPDHRRCPSAAWRRAHGAEPAGAAVGRRDADRALRRRPSRAPACGSSTRARRSPGLRALQKAAVVAGGGVSHRFGLFDAILIKENHIALAGGIAAAVAAAREALSRAPARGRVRDRRRRSPRRSRRARRGSCSTTWGPDELRAAVAINVAAGRPAELEASGGVTLETVRSFAVAGLDFISVGALTHSAPALDLSLLLEALIP